MYMHFTEESSVQAFIMYVESVPFEWKEKRKRVFFEINFLKNCISPVPSVETSKARFLFTLFLLNFEKRFDRQASMDSKFITSDSPPHTPPPQSSLQFSIFSCAPLVIREHGECMLCRLNLFLIKKPTGHGTHRLNQGCQIFLSNHTKTGKMYQMIAN
jgi:hypothetical protein